VYDDKRIIKVLSQFKNIEWQVFSRHNKTKFKQDNISIQPIYNEAFIKSLTAAEGYRAVLVLRHRLWSNRNVVNWFSHYAECCTKYFGNGVKQWMVLNELMVFTGAGYFLGIPAPGTRSCTQFNFTINLPLVI
jgi:hypothetical protein